MGHSHEPSHEFIERMERQIGLEVRRRNIAPRRSRLTVALRAAALVLGSMGIGAAAVASAYQAQDSQRRDQVAASVEQRASLAQQQLAAAAELLQRAQRQVQAGLASEQSLLESRLKVASAEADLKSIQLQLEEIRVTSREPRNDLSAPMVAGRDFVAERLHAAMTVPEQALALELSRLLDTERRFRVGVVSELEVAVSRARVREAELALLDVRAKLEIRYRFLSGQIDAVEAELRVLESEAEHRRKRLEPKVEIARQEMERTAAKVKVGLTQQVQLAEATLRKLELETELSKVQLELALVRKRLDEHRAGR